MVVQGSRLVREDRMGTNYFDLRARGFVYGTSHVVNPPEEARPVQSVMAGRDPGQGLIVHLP